MRLDPAFKSSVGYNCRKSSGEGTKMEKPMVNVSPQEAIAQLGGGHAISEMIKAFQKVTDRLETDRSSLMKQYPKQWVAVGGDGLIAHSESVEDLVADVRGKGFGSSEYVLEFLDPIRQHFLL